MSATQKPCMNLTNFQEIALDKITIGEDRRSLDPDWVEALAESIAEQGLLNPITVRPLDNAAVGRSAPGTPADREIETRFVLITGHHRLAACGLLENKTITASIRDYKEGDAPYYRLEEITENVFRNELNALDRAHALYELDQIYKKLYPEWKKGGNKQTAEARQNLTAIIAVRSELYEKVGLSERSFRLATAIWRGLSKQSKARIYGTWLAKHQAGLVSLADQTPANQKKLLDILFPAKGEAEATSVADALTIINEGRLLTYVERKYTSINRALSNLKNDELDMIFAAHEAKIMAWLERREAG